MMRRQFRDEHGEVWDVWDVIPRDVLGHGVYDRRSIDRPQPDVSQAPPALQPELEHGWLCFQHNAKRRRFAPIPPGWSDLPDGVLRVMLDIASPVESLGTAQPKPSAAE
jgi:hypothetical protein